LDLEKLQKVKKYHLKASVVFRVQKDSRIRFKNMNKGTVGEARNGGMNGLVLKAKELANERVITEIPDLPVPELPQPMGFTKVEVVHFCWT
jgi:hypothetical protein